MNRDSEKRIGAYIDYEDEANGDDDSRRNRYDASDYDTGELGAGDAQSDVIDSLPPSDDPVKMYLKEIGQVPLLDSNREMWLSAIRYLRGPRLGRRAAFRVEGPAQSGGESVGSCRHLPALARPEGRPR